MPSLDVPEGLADVSSASISPSIRATRRRASGYIVRKSTNIDVILLGFDPIRGASLASAGCADVHYLHASLGMARADPVDALDDGSGWSRGLRPGICLGDPLGDPPDSERLGRSGRGAIPDRSRFRSGGLVRERGRVLASLSIDAASAGNRLGIRLTKISATSHRSLPAPAPPALPPSLQTCSEVGSKRPSGSGRERRASRSPVARLVRPSRLG
jgi:hypothetical protein